MSFGDCTSVEEVQEKAKRFLDATLSAFGDLGIVIKGNTLFRLLGSSALVEVRSAGCQIFGDYKLFDVRGTLENDASWLRLFFGLHILTVAEDVHPDVFSMLKLVLPDVIVAPVNPLTDLSDAQFARRGEVSRADATRAFFARVATLQAQGVICAPSDLQYAPAGFTEGREIITPAIRPEWAVLPGDKNAANALTPRQAILNGATKLVVGSPLRHNGTLRDNALRVLDEIGEAIGG